MGKGKKLQQRPFQYISKVRNPLFFAALLIAAIYALSNIKLVQFFPIRTVHIYGANRVNQHDIQDVLTPLVENGFFATKIDRIRERLLEFSWVSDSLVRRTWPDLVDITIKEKNALAYWCDSSLLSDNGEIFSPERTTWPSNLPKFVGPPGKQIQMLEHFKNINRILEPIHANIAYLELTPYDAWKLKLDNGITLQMGQKDVLTRLEHFVKVYSRIIGQRAEDVDYIDLRYPNGVAVKRKANLS